MGLKAHILPTSKICSTNKASCESSENVFAKKAKTYILTYFGPIRGQKEPTYMTLYVYILHASEGNSNKLKDKFNANLMETFGEIGLWVLLALFRFAKDPKKWPLEPIFFTLLKLVSMS